MDAVCNNQVTTYQLSPEELAEIHRKYGPPKVKPDKYNGYVPAKRKPPLTADGKKKSKAEKVASVKRVRKTQCVGHYTRHVTKEELEAALAKGGTVEEARNILHIGNDVIRKFMREYGITHRNRRLIYRDENGKVCSGPCNTYKPWSAFNKNKGLCDGHEAYCRECSNAYRRARKAKKKANS